MPTIQRATTHVSKYEMEEGSYCGEIDREFLIPHGNGRIDYKKDHPELVNYEGGWYLGAWHGYGVIQFANGDSYLGEFQQHQREGKGTYLWKDGRTYEGDFHGNQRHGKGVYRFADGAIYRGDFCNGHREGQGVYEFPDGNKYEGTWKEGHYDGYGVFTWKDGRVYRGEWKQSKHHGIGVEIDAKGCIIHDGMWFDHEPLVRESPRPRSPADKEKSSVDNPSRPRPLTNGERRTSGSRGANSRLISQGEIPPMLPSHVSELIQSQREALDRYNKKLSQQETLDWCSRPRHSAPEPQQHTQLVGTVQRVHRQSAPERQHQQIVGAARN